MVNTGLTGFDWVFESNKENYLTITPKVINLFGEQLRAVA
jgi:hypothetical protein